MIFKLTFKYKNDFYNVLCSENIKEAFSITVWQYFKKYRGFNCGSVSDVCALVDRGWQIPGADLANLLTRHGNTCIN